MKLRGFELPKGRSAPEAKAKVIKPKATTPKKPRGKKAKQEAIQEEIQASGNEASGSGDEEIQDYANEELVVTSEAEEA